MRGLRSHITIFRRRIACFASSEDSVRHRVIKTTVTSSKSNLKFEAAPSSSIACDPTMNIPSSLVNQPQQPMIGSHDYQRLSLRKRKLCNYNETENDSDSDKRSEAFYKEHHDDGDKAGSPCIKQKKAVQQLDPHTKTVVAQFPSVTSAAKAMQVSLPAICLAIRKYKQQVHATSAGFIWRPAPETLEEDSECNESSSLEQGNELDYIPSSNHEKSSPSIDDDNDDSDDDTRKMENKTLGNIASEDEPTLDSSSSQDEDDSVVLTVDHRGRPGLQVEQLCLQTGQVLQSFASISEASRDTGLAHKSIRYNLDKVYSGFFWRRKGSQALPLPLPAPNKVEEQKQEQQQTSCYAPSTEMIASVPVAAYASVLPKAKRQKTDSTVRTVEKVCLKTGKVMARFESISMAAKATGAAYSSIHCIVKGYRGRVSCQGYGWRHALSPGAAKSTEITVSVPVASTTVLPKIPKGQTKRTTVLPKVLIKGQQTYIPRSGDRFRVFFDTVKDCFGERKEAAGWYTGTATDITLWDDKQYLVYLRFDDHADDNFLFPAADIQRLLPTSPTEQAASNKVFAFDEEREDALQVAYESSPDHIEVGDVICCNYQADTKAEGQWHRGRVAIVHKSGRCDVVFDDGDHHCKIPKKRLRLMERGRDTKGWVVGLSIKLQEHRRFGKLAPAKILRVQDDDDDDDERVVLMFPNWLEIHRPYEQVAAALMREALNKAKERR